MTRRLPWVITIFAAVVFTSTWPIGEVIDEINLKQVIGDFYAIGDLIRSGGNSLSVKVDGAEFGISCAITGTEDKVQSKDPLLNHNTMAFIEPVAVGDEGMLYEVKHALSDNRLYLLFRRANVRGTLSPLSVAQPDGGTSARES